MCQIAWHDGVHAIAATAHQNDLWPEVNVERILAATRELRRQLQNAGLRLALYPCAEAMVTPDLDELWRQGLLISDQSSVIDDSYQLTTSSTET